MKVLETAKKSVAQRQKMNELRGISKLALLHHMSLIPSSTSFGFASDAMLHHGHSLLQIGNDACSLTSFSQHCAAESSDAISDLL